LTPSAAPLVLVCSGLDPSGGAGFALDLRVVAEFGGVACGAVTALTVQDSRGVRRCEPVNEEVLGEQLAAVLSDFEIAAVKLGLVPSGSMAHVIASALAQTAAPVIWDPVFSATAGTPLLYDDPRVIAEVLAPECALITPNLGEAAVLGENGHAIRAAYGCDVLIKGGHASDASATDVLFDAIGARELAAERVIGAAPRGTGCFLSSAIATAIAGDASVFEAISSSKEALTTRLRTVTKRGRGAPHLF